MNAQDSPDVRDTGPLTVTAIVCSYNEEKTLPAALHSLFSQTRVPDEVIVVNNASTDRTRAVVERIPGIVVVDEPDKGLVRARARGMQAAKHLFSWKTLVRSRKDWPALKTGAHRQHECRDHTIPRGVLDRVTRALPAARTPDLLILPMVGMRRQRSLSLPCDACRFPEAKRSET